MVLWSNPTEISLLDGTKSIHCCCWHFCFVHSALLFLVEYNSGYVPITKSFTTENFDDGLSSDDCAEFSFEKCNLYFFPYQTQIRISFGLEIPLFENIEQNRSIAETDGYWWWKENHLRQCQSKMIVIEYRWTGANGRQARIDSQEGSATCLERLAGNLLWVCCSNVCCQRLDRLFFLKRQAFLWKRWESEITFSMRRNYQQNQCKFHPSRTARQQQDIEG